MLKVIVPLGLLAAAAIAWALLPTTPPKPSERANAALPEAATTAKAELDAQVLGPSATTARPAPPVVLNELPARPETPAAPAMPPPAAPAEGVAPPPAPMPMPKVSATEFKAAMRHIYGNLPKSGTVPGLTLEELLTPALVKAVGLPPASRVTGIGSWEASRVEGFEEALKLPEGEDSHFGLTVVTPEGESRRVYLRTEAR